MINCLYLLETLKISSENKHKIGTYFVKEVDFSLLHTKRFVIGTARCGIGLQKYL